MPSIVKTKSKYKIKGTIVSKTPRNRAQQKNETLSSNKVTMGKRVPTQNEGKVGDITVRELVGRGLRCYIKTDTGWYDINLLTSNFMPNWIDVNIATGWATDDTYGKPQFMKDSHGFVHLRGGVDSGNIGNAITTLPINYRPSKEQRRLVNRLLDVGTLYVQVIRITTAGEIKRLSGFAMINTTTGYGSSSARGDNTDGDLLNDNVNLDTTTEVCLDGISFFAGKKEISVSSGGSEFEKSNINRGIVI